jgi:hypothetical protein
MLREDDPSRFDYLFEPIDAAEADDDNVDEGPPAEEQPDTDRRRPGASKIALAAFVIATVAGVGGIVVLLLPRHELSDRLNTPTNRSTPTMTAPPKMPTPSVLAPSPSLTPSRVSPPLRTVYLRPQPPPPPAPTAGRNPEVGVTRAPISVQPEPRTPFPNENTGDADEEDGGILGGLPGVGDLPGPL